MKKPRNALYWWQWMVTIGGLLFALACVLLRIVFGPDSIVGAYYVLGLVALAVLFAYLAAVARVTILIRDRTLRTNPAAANRWILIWLGVTLLLPTSIALIIAVFGGLIGEALSRD